MVNIRVFLAAYMVAFRPDKVFESMGELESALHKAALPLLKTFESLCRSIKQNGSTIVLVDVNSEQAKAFPELLFEYLKCFKAWKVPDEARLTSRIKHALVALYQAREHLSSDEQDSVALKEEFRVQIKGLRSRLANIAGADALVRFDREHGRMSTDLAKLDEVLPTLKTSVSSELARRQRMTNEQLAHELMLDPRFQLLDNGGAVENPVFKRINQSFHQAFWDSVVDDLKLDPPCYVRVLRVLVEVRDGISQLAASVESSLIAEIIDLDLMKQQASQGTTWESSMSFIGAIVGVILRVQAPQRGEETSGKWNDLHKVMLKAEPEEKPSLFCNALEFLLNRVNVMRIDAANARLRLNAPIILDHGILYEQGKLQDKITAGTLTLEKTKAWIQTAISRQASVQPDFKALISNGVESSYMLVHNLAVVNIATDNTKEVLAENVPETLAFDVHRLKCSQVEFNSLVSASTMLLTAASQLKYVNGPPVVMQLRLQSLADHILAQPVGSTMSAAHIEMAMSNSELTVIPDIDPFALKLSNAFKQCVAPSDAVHQLMQQRVRALLVHLISDNNTPAGHAALSGLTAMLGAARMLLPQIQAMAKKLKVVADHSMRVHGARYCDLILAVANKV